MVKDPLPNKGARISTHVTLPGRYLVLLPTVRHFGVSRRIEDEAERERLLALLQPAPVTTGGLIVRTVGEGKGREEFDSDLAYLSRLWEKVRQRAGKVSAPTLLHQDLDLALRVVRDLLRQDFAVLWVDGEETYERIVEFLDQVQPGLVAKVKLFRQERDPVRAVRHRGADRGGPQEQGLAQVGRLHRHQPHRGAGRDRRQHRPLRRARATSRTRCCRPTSRRSRRSCARSACATWAASSSST